MKEYRKFMKSNWEETAGDFSPDQQKGIPAPALEKAIAADLDIVELPQVNLNEGKAVNFLKLITERSSVRKFAKETITLEELSILLYCTQGVKEIVGKGMASLRTVPSGGARHPFETYLVINDVEGVRPGVYRYMALEHELAFLYTSETLPEKLTQATCGQKFCGQAPVTFIWSCIPYRAEWRYSMRSHKVMLLDAGHICQNLYLACEALELGTCAIAAYYQSEIDQIIQVDGEDEYTVYLAPVGRKAIV